MPDVATLERAAAAWFLPDPTPTAAAAGGYWLADVFLRGTTEEEVPLLTRFLIGSAMIPPCAGRLPSVRRYPTGGVSEKQALILPPLVRAISDRMGWCSPFLIAKRLAHTGGTIDKLAVLPGFTPASSKMLAGWTGRPVPVLYVTTGTDICSRDAAMYRMRGETGTVADQGLMAASILCKQVAVPVDGLILDVLHGPTAFLKDIDEAHRFGQLCVKVAIELGISATPSYRAAYSPQGHAIGSSTEVLEAVELLRGVPTKYHPEIVQALGFIELMANARGLDGRAARMLAQNALETGAAYSHLLDLWRDHGVDGQFLDQVSRDARKAILSNLKPIPIHATATGVLRYNWVRLADAVNNRLNGFRAAGDGPATLTAGGVQIKATDGAFVKNGELLLEAHVSAVDPDAISELSDTFEIKAGAASASH
ncbi:hypothetical protein EN813_037680 [Mesorhizobium sp. M00.F.Ca.ET.170.01.1.1]|nr:hypothetical protein EN813_037680 [Mesorhizobium sp. M00.F.Ca.ET.170.01.1.1]